MEPIPKPPLGILPRKLWDERRMYDIYEAARRYQEARVPIPEEWQFEYNELVARHYG